MKRYLLFVMLCVCVSIGAWATVTISGSGTVTVNVGVAGETSTDFSSVANYSNLNGATTIIVTGAANATDLTNILGATGGSWTLNKLDLSGLTNFNTSDFPNPLDPNTTNDIRKFILPAGADAPTDTQCNYVSDGNANNGNYNRYGDLEYIIIPAAATDNPKVAKLYVNKQKNYPFCITSIDESSLNDADQILVYGLNGAENQANYQTLITSLGDKVKIAVKPYTLSDTKYELVNNNDNANNIGDRIYWKVNSATTQSVVTIEVSDEMSLQEALTALNTDYPNVKFQKMIIKGSLDADDMSSFSLINANALDLTGATFVETSTTSSILANASNDKVHEIVLPAGLKRDATETAPGYLNSTTLAGFTGLYAAVSVTSLPDSKYSVTSYVKEPGSLQSTMTLLGWPEATTAWTYNTHNQKISATESVNVLLMSNSQTSKISEIVVSGRINSFDITSTATLQGGHIAYEEGKEPLEPSNGSATAQHGTLTGYTVEGPFSGVTTVTKIDLRDASFGGIHTDFTIARLGIMSQTATHELVIPQTDDVTEIPRDFFYVPNGSMNGIKEICIPYNIEKIGAYAFLGSLDHIWTTAGPRDPEGANTKLDNGAVTVGSDKSETVHYGYKTNYDSFNYGTYTFSSNLKLIESSAFANSTPHVKDVYVLNTTAPECHVDAFNKKMYFGISGFDPVITEGIITRDSYTNGQDAWITMLHYPRQTTTPDVQRYTDPTRSYSIATGMRDGKGATLYFPTQSEFIRAYAQGTFGYTWNAWNPAREYNAVKNGAFDNGADTWNAEDQGKANALYTAYKTSIGASGKEPNHKYFTFYDVSLGGASNVPEDIVPYWKINWNEVAYSTNENGGNLYPRRGTENPDFGVATARDYRGWHQFVLTEYAANTTLQEEPYRSYITDNEWWTICPTFDITRKEAALLFGKFPGLTSSSETAYPFVSKLRYVIRDYVNKKITLNFSENLTQNREHRAHETDYLKDENGNPVYNGENKIYLGTNPDKHGELDANGVLIIDINTINDDDVVMSAGVPYLIKPAMRDNAIRQFRIFRTTQERDSYVYNISEEERSKVVAVASETLYDKMVAAKEKTGEEQMADIHAGKYTVPVFVNGTNSAVKMESVEMGTDGHPKKFQISSTQYSKSTDWKYTFVGTFYKSYMPLHSYFLGWDSSLNSGKGGARFYYYDQEDTFTKNNMTWANETGIICPTYQSDFTYTVSAATGAEDPAQWELNGLIPDDSYVAAGSGASSKSYSMVFDAPDVFEETGFATVINEVNTESDSMNRQLDVYSVDGQFMGHSLNGLSKGIYVVNGKKYVVK